MNFTFFKISGRKINMENKKLRVALLAGGTSPEREVSKSSGSSIYKALLSLGYETKLIDPAYGKNQPTDSEAFFSEADFAEISTRNYIEVINSDLFDDVDIAFLGLHGKWGEDGTIQSLLEMRGIKYTGSNILASANGMDKEMSKILFRHFNVSTPEWLVIENSKFDLNGIQSSIENKFGYPCVIKPNDQGSTVGLTVCKNKNEVKGAIELALSFSKKALIEEYIDGHELTVAVLENKALPVLEIKPKHGLYDYECKYTKGMSEYIVPAQIPENVFMELQKESEEAFKALGCSVYGRLDYRMSNDFKIYCLEVNTLPGMTSTSLVPKMAKAVGISFEELIDKIINLSLK